MVNHKGAHPRMPVLIDSGISQAPQQAVRVGGAIEDIALGDGRYCLVGTILVISNDLLDVVVTC